MAIENHIGVSEDWFIDEDKLIDFEVYDNTGAAMADVTGWSVRFVLRRPLEGDAIKLDKATGGSGITIVGVYNAVPATNTQRVRVTVADTDTDTLQPGNYLYALKRTDSGAETVLAHGNAHLKKAPL